MSRNAQNLGLATPTPWVRGSVAFSLKIFGWKVYEMSRCTHKTAFCQPPLLIGIGGVNLLNPYFAGNYIRCPEVYRKVMFAYPPTPMMWTQLTKFFFTSNCMIYPDLYRTVIYGQLHTPHGGVDGVKQSIYKMFLPWIE